MSKVNPVGLLWIIIRVRLLAIHLHSVHKTLLPYHCRHTVVESESAVAIPNSEAVQQLQQELTKKNMFFSKDLIELSKVIGQGKYLSIVCAVLTE